MGDLREFHPLYAPAPLLAQFEALPLVTKVRGWREDLRSRWADLDVPFEVYEWAAVLVWERAYGDCFMPIADLLNTAEAPNVEVFDELEVIGEAGEYYGLLPSTGIPCGAELLQPYAAVDNAERLFRGGFLLEGNPVPVVPIPKPPVDWTAPNSRTVALLQDL